MKIFSNYFHALHLSLSPSSIPISNTRIPINNLNNVLYTSLTTILSTTTFSQILLFLTSQTLVLLSCHDSNMESTVSVTVTSMANEFDSNKENHPPKEEMKKKKKNPIPVMMAPSFKKKGNRKTNKKRIPLSDITHLLRNSAHEPNGGGVSDALPSSSDSDSVVLNSNPRKRRTMVAAPGSKTKSLRMGFR